MPLGRHRSTAPGLIARYGGLSASARTGRRSERGASSLELAILAPTIMALIFVSIQTALWLYGRSVALNAAQEGVSRLRMVQPTLYSPAIGEKVRADIEAYAQQLGGNSLGDANVDFPAYNDPEGQVSFTVTGETISLVPGLTLTVSRTATGPIEQFEADDGE
ncbi:TadE/TadG family type IV pilus assembly protein [Kribbella sp. CA-253562]|uniref:TadE/TadG family type IV pilus assembly protein n=1 Tax=Kribbella sp. CA-253562 TaxID=3239942 RepID=UPI003D92D97B